MSGNSQPSEQDSKGCHRVNAHQWNRQIVLEKLAQHEAHLTMAEIGLSDLRKQRHDLYQLLNVTTPMMSILPLDVFVEIFYAACIDDVELSKHPSQFLIGSVCRAWRHVAWTTPGLWSKINIILSHKIYENQIYLLQEWLFRSGACLLDWNIKLAHSSHKASWDPPVDFFFMIFQTCHRWKSFEFFGPSKNLRLALSQTPNVQFPKLKCLDLLGATRSKEWAFRWPPILETLHLRKNRTSWNLQLDWTILTTLEVRSYLKDIVAHLPALNSVRTLGVDLRGSSLPMPFTNPPYQLPCLTNLQVTGGTSVVGPLLALLKVPVLETLIIEMMAVAANPDYPWNDDFIKMAEQSSFRLTTLYMDINIKAREANEDIEEHVLSVLAEIPSIEKFTFSCEHHNYYVLANSFIRHLCLSSSNPSRPVHLPNLCYFEYRGPLDVELEVLYSMIEYKLNSLQSNTLTSNGTPVPPKKFELKFVYSNIHWYRDQDPDALHVFYANLAQFDANTFSFELVWDRPD